MGYTLRSLSERTLRPRKVDKVEVGSYGSCRPGAPYTRLFEYDGEDGVGARRGLVHVCLIGLYIYAKENHVCFIIQTCVCVSVLRLRWRTQNTEHTHTPAA